MLAADHLDVGRYAHITTLSKDQTLRAHSERHYSHRVGWLRAAVLGANDGIVSTASLVIGVAAANAGPREVLIAGVAGLVAGSLSMAAGEYVSVSAQADSERADLDREREELKAHPVHEHRELAQIYEGRGLDASLAHRVSTQLMEHDALGAHARDELGLSDIHTARPLQAALASAGTFALGAVLPLLVVSLLKPAPTILVVAASSLMFLALLGWMAARAGGANVLTGVARVVLWGALAMSATAAVGALFGSLI
ncbi:MAG: VIT1/CCC1 family predicted Fe2+/Mn2+ transporter [Gammaproteobacteria bacterium]|jgi:VIT1/CCC1 family predicted Fe2+/Mn2+ transporter